MNVPDAISLRSALRHKASGPIFFGMSALLFTANASATVIGYMAMSGMGGMSMPGGWTMSMMWMKMPGQTWLGSALGFQLMWLAMMVAMMLPSLAPMLWRYRQAEGLSEKPLPGLPTLLVGAGYFFVWTAIGMAVYPLGVALGAVLMQQAGLSRTVPIVAGMVVLAAGILQFTPWKSRHLACCREVPGCGHTFRGDTATAWRQGIRLGLHCAQCCAGLMAILLVTGAMDLRAMAAVTAAITAERLGGERIARIIGAICAGAGLILAAQAIMSG